MRYNLLGNTGLFVSELCFGAMTFGGGDQGFWSTFGNVPQTEADDLLRVAFDAGINFIDTADVYGGGQSERITGQTLKNLGMRRDDVVIATKFLGQMGKGPNTRGATRYHIMQALEDSLERLQLDHIDLYQIHAFDNTTPMEETLKALDAVVRQGRVRYIGLSNWAAWQIMKAQGISEKKGLERFECVQAHYSLACRDLEREIVPLLESERIGLMIWSPLSGGFLSGKYPRNPAAGAAEGRRAATDFPPVDKDKGWQIIDVMSDIARKKNASVAQIALSWLLHKPVVTSVIIGVKHQDQLLDNIGSTRVVLSADELASLDAVSALKPEYSEWMAGMGGDHPWDPKNRKPRGAI